MIEKNIEIMGGDLYLYILSKDQTIDEEIADFIIDKIKDLVDVFNFFDKKSLLSTLNVKRKIPFNDDIDFLLKESIRFKEISNNKFNVFLGKQIRNRKLDLLDSKFDKNIKGNFFEIGEENISLLNPNIIVDLGGIAKGYIIDKALELALEKYSKIIIDVLIDARGDIVCYGKNKKVIEIENPFNEDIFFAKINLKNGSVITSGHNKQKFKNGSHIIGDKTDILTITLISNSKKCFELDALGTYLIQLSSYEVMEKIEFDDIFKDIECLLILNDGSVLKSGFWESFN